MIKYDGKDPSYKGVLMTKQRAKMIDIQYDKMHKRKVVKKEK